MFAVLTKHRNVYREEDFKKAIKRINQFNIKIDIVLKYGIYCVDNDTTPVNIMCDRACLAAEGIKDKYNENYAYYDDEARQRLLDEQFITSTMNIALKEEEFKVYFQPKYDVKTAQIVGAEALIRWDHPDRGFMSPSEFIPLFEKNGFIMDLDMYVWEKCCKKIREWKDNGYPLVPISVNISRVDVYNPRLCDMLISIVRKYNLSPKYLHIEITETAYTENPEQLISVANQLKKIGFLIEMDDFGTGYSSLNMLAELPIDILKLDITFIQGRKIFENRNILSFIISLSKWLNLSVIAEGVESKEQVKLLQALNCDYAQGYYYAKPLREKEFEALLYQAGFSDSRAEALEHDEKHHQSNNILTKKMMVLDKESKDYNEFRKGFSNNYVLVKTKTYDETITKIQTLEDEIEILIINFDDVNELQLENICNECKKYSIPVIIICDSLNKVLNHIVDFGISDYILRPYTIAAVKSRINNTVFSEQMASFNSEKELSKALVEMKKRAQQDSLTGLLNRSEFEERICNFFVDNKNPEGIFIIFDVDNFKGINDTYGHINGDMILRDMAENIRLNLDETDIIGRMGGDEFVVFIPYIIQLVELEKKLYKICTAKTLINSNVSCSAGVCLSPSNGKNYEQLYANADRALLKAKRNGKAKYQIFQKDMDFGHGESFDYNALTLLDNTSDAMFVCDAVSSKIMYINDTACSIIGMSKEKCLGERCYEVFWDNCRNCDRCFSIGDWEEFYEEDTYLKDGVTPVHIKARLGIWDGQKVKIHYLRIKDSE